MAPATPFKPMSFRNWLPITRINRVALVFALIGLLCAVGWNFLPWYSLAYSSGVANWTPYGWAGATIWPEVFSPYSYRIARFGELGIYGFLIPISCLSIAIHALSAFLTFCVWQTIHATGALRLSLAMANALGGLAVLALQILGGTDHFPHHLVIGVMTLGMFSTATALFVFKNELALREERSRSPVG